MNLQAQSDGLHAVLMNLTIGIVLGNIDNTVKHCQCVPCNNISAFIENPSSHCTLCGHDMSDFAPTCFVFGMP